jgi:ElaB/YqjD/DUF883 family membrane-anchored ribosome-binding protein
LEDIMTEQVHTEAGRSATQRASEVRDELRDRAKETDHAVREFVTDHPFVAVGAAVAAGFFVARLIAKR